MPTKKDVYLKKGMGMVNEINALLTEDALKEYNKVFSGDTRLMNLLQGTLVATYDYLINDMIESNLNCIKQSKEKRSTISDTNYDKGNNLNAEGLKGEAAPFIQKGRIYRSSFYEIKNLIKEYNEIKKDDSNIIDLNDAYKLLSTLERIKKIEVPLHGDQRDPGDEFSDFLEKTLYSTYNLLINEKVRYFVEKLRGDDDDLITAKLDYQEQASVLFEQNRDEEAMVMKQKAESLDDVLRIFNGVCTTYYDVQDLVK